MALTILDPVAALVVIDLQAGVVALPTVHPAADIVRRSAALARAFRRKGLPVVLVSVNGGAPGRTETPRRPAPPEGWDRLVEELGVEADDHHIVKRTWGAFQDTGLDALLKENAVTQIVLTGIATSLGVESTARGAHERGYHVVLVTDAMTDLNAEAHRNSIEWVFPRIGETANTADVLAQLAAG